MANNLGVTTGVNATIKTTDNAGVHTTHHNIDTLPAIPAGTNNIGDVDVLTLPSIPAGNNNIGDVDIASIAAGDNNIGNVDVVTLPSIPAGTNNIGDVDVMSIIPGTNANNLGKAEDVAHNSNDVGVMALAVRNDAGVTLALADGRYAPLSVDSSGNLRVSGGGGGTQYTEADTDASITGTAVLWEDTADTLRPVSAAKPLPVAIISGAGSGGTALQDGAVFTPDTTNFTPMGGYRDDTSPATVTEGDGAAVRITTNRAIHVNMRDASGNEVVQPALGAALSAASMPVVPATDWFGPIESRTSTAALMNGPTVALTPKFAAISASSSGNNTILAAVTSKKIRVVAYSLVANGAVNAKFQSGAGGTDLTGLKYFSGVGSGIVQGYNPLGWFETASNTLLNLNLSGAVAVGGEIVYVEV